MKIAMVALFAVGALGQGFDTGPQCCLESLPIADQAPWCDADSRFRLGSSCPDDEDCCDFNAGGVAAGEFHCCTNGNSCLPCDGDDSCDLGLGQTNLCKPDPNAVNPACPQCCPGGQFKGDPACSTAKEGSDYNFNCCPDGTFCCNRDGDFSGLDQDGGVIDGFHCCATESQCEIDPITLTNVCANLDPTTFPTRSPTLLPTRFPTKTPVSSEPTSSPTGEPTETTDAPSTDDDDDDDDFLKAYIFSQLFG